MIRAMQRFHSVVRSTFIFFAFVGTSSTAAAQTTVTLPDTTHTTSVSAVVSEQARITIPASITFSVSDVGSSTAAAATTVSLDRIVLGSATKQLKISLQAGAADFTPPVAGATTWAATDVSWNAATWTSATGAAGTLSSGTYVEVATCDANATGCSTSGLVFTLAAKPTVQRAGTHSVVVTWKFESTGS